MINEGHDFEPEWLKLVTQMVDPATDSLLLLYDDAQSTYRKSRGLDFSLSCVGIKAAGRTWILRLPICSWQTGPASGPNIHGNPRSIFSPYKAARTLSSAP